MARTYSKQFLVKLNAREETPAILLARLCVEANLPAKYVSNALEVSSTTMYAWFRGANVDKDNLKKVEAFNSILKNDIAAGHLPVKSLKEAKLYISNVIGVDQP